MLRFVHKLTCTKDNVLICVHTYLYQGQCSDLCAYILVLGTMFWFVCIHTCTRDNVLICVHTYLYQGQCSDLCAYILVPGTMFWFVCIHTCTKDNVLIWKHTYLYPGQCSDLEAYLLVPGTIIWFAFKVGARQAWDWDVEQVRFRIEPTFFQVWSKFVFYLIVSENIMELTMTIHN